MKKISVMVGILVLGLLGNKVLFAQQKSNGMIAEQRQPSYVAVNENMAVNLIFPVAVKRAQWISPAIVVQQFKGVDNILLLKANRKDFPLTNVSVVTTDGRFYSFVIGYASELTAINLDYTSFAGTADAMLSSKGQPSEADVEVLSKRALNGQSPTGRIKQKKYGIGFSLDGIFIHQNTMFYRVSVTNYTNVQYDIDQLRFYLRDEKKASRTATQEIEMVPLFKLGPAVTIKGNSQETFVYALKKFTIPDRKYMTVELMEKNGGRHLELKVKNSKVLQAKSL